MDQAKINHNNRTLEYNDTIQAEDNVNRDNIKLLSLCTYFFIQTIRDGSGCGLVDDSQNFQASDDSSIFGGLKNKT